MGIPDLNPKLRTDSSRAYWSGLKISLCDLICRVWCAGARSWYRISAKWILAWMSYTCHHAGSPFGLTDGVPQFCRLLSGSFKSNVRMFRITRLFKMHPDGSQLFRCRHPLVSALGGAPQTRATMAAPCCPSGSHGPLAADMAVLTGSRDGRTPGGIQSCEAERERERQLRQKHLWVIASRLPPCATCGIFVVSNGSTSILFSVSGLPNLLTCVSVSVCVCVFVLYPLQGQAVA